MPAVNAPAIHAGIPKSGKGSTACLACKLVVHLILAFLINIHNYYHADQTTIEELECTDRVTVNKIHYGWYFDCPLKRNL